MNMKKNKKTIIILVLSLLVLGIFGVVFAQKIYFAPTDKIALPDNIENKYINRIPSTTKIVTDTGVKSIEESFSRRLTIPTLNINAKIQDVGITNKGNMSTPNNFFDVGLYKYGPLPGEVGSAVIDGHVNNGFGFNAVFGNLKNIKVGDDIYVEIEKGTKVHFVVTSTSIYNYNAPAREVFEQSDGSYLKLITCTGNWVQALRTHDKRLVVNAVKIEI
jgi:LPXTG-site transpeptidase (sortase) family protein